MNTHSISKLKEHPNFEELHIIRDDNNNVVAVSMKYFAAAYKDKIRCSYNDMFSVLRSENVIMKIEFNGKTTNVPTDGYKNLFIEKEVSHDDVTTIKLFVRKDGVELILRVLKEKNYIK